MTIAAILREKGSRVVSVHPEDTVGQVAAALAQHRIGAALVRDADGAIAGIVSERDIVRGIVGHGADVLAQTAARVMTRELVTVAPHDTVQSAMSLMTGRRIRHLPVLEDGRLVGMVSIGDLVKARIDEAEHEAAELRAYVNTAG